VTGCDRRRLRLRGTVAVPVPPAEAIELFTPSGERRWASGWDPSFPAPAADETEPGTVFETNSHGPLTWVVVGRESGRSVKYAIVAPGIRAGTIEVACADAGSGTTIATVTYDMTALSADGEGWLADFAAGYDAYLDHWCHAISAAIGI
jgi:Polyketide cyclase / dehydrase and lipid transport